MPPPARGCLRSEQTCAGRAGGGRRCRSDPPETRPQAWMARAKGRFVHEKGRFGGWQGQKSSSSTKMADLVDGGRQETETGEGAGRLKSSRRKTKDFRSFPPISFVFRPLTPPYVPFGIRRFLTFCAFEHSSPADRGSLLCGVAGL